MRLLPLALGVLWPAVAIAEPSEEELVATIVHTPRFPEAEDAVRSLLGDLHDEERVAELRAWVDRLADDPVITFRRAELAGQLRRLQLQFLRGDADTVEYEARRENTPAAFVRCADAYANVRGRLETGPEVSDVYWRTAQLAEVRFNEAICSEHAGDPIHAMALYVEVTEGSLGRQASARLVRLLGALPQIGFARVVGAPLAKVEMPRKTFEYDFADDVID